MQRTSQVIQLAAGERDFFVEISRPFLQLCDAADTEVFERKHNINGGDLGPARQRRTFGA